jgi:hypothetical protein
MAPTMGGPMMPPSTTAVLTSGSATACSLPRQTRADSTIMGGLDAAPNAIVSASVMNPPTPEAVKMTGRSMCSTPASVMHAATWKKCSWRRCALIATRTDTTAARA